MICSLLQYQGSTARVGIVTMEQAWGLADIPDLQGKVAVVTGARYVADSYLSCDLKADEDIDVQQRDWPGNSCPARRPRSKGLSYRTIPTEGRESKANVAGVLP